MGIPVSLTLKVRHGADQSPRGSGQLRGLRAARLKSAHVRRRAIVDMLSNVGLERRRRHVDGVCVLGPRTGLIGSLHRCLDPVTSVAAAAAHDEEPLQAFPPHRRVRESQRVRLLSLWQRALRQVREASRRACSTRSWSCSSRHVHRSPLRPMALAALHAGHAPRALDATSTDRVSGCATFRNSAISGSVQSHAIAKRHHLPLATAAKRSPLHRARQCDNA